MACVAIIPICGIGNPMGFATWRRLLRIDVHFTYIIENLFSACKKWFLIQHVSFAFIMTRFHSHGMGRHVPHRWSSQKPMVVVVGRSSLNIDVNIAHNNPSFLSEN